jgi:hypothetical protein
VIRQPADRYPYRRVARYSTTSGPAGMRPEAGRSYFSQDLCFSHLCFNWACCSGVRIANNFS